MKSVTRNVTKTRNSNIVVSRQLTLQEIQNKDYEKGTRLKKTQIIEKMKEKGYKDYNRMTLYRDNNAFNKHSTFIKDLITTNYSAYVEQVFNYLSLIEEDAEDILKKQWTQNKTVITRENAEKGESTYTVTKHTTEEIASPKLEALKILLKSQEIKHKIITGDNLQLSAAMLAQKFQEMDAEIKRLRNLVPKKKGTLKKLEKKNASTR